MRTADFWLEEKQLVHKLFKVLVPRFENCSVSYTRMYKAPREYPGQPYKRAVLELRGNPYPSLLPDRSQNRNLIHNLLLDEARRDYRKAKYADIATKIQGSAEADSSKDSDTTARSSNPESVVKEVEKKE